MHEKIHDHLMTVLLELMRESTGLDASHLTASTLFEDIGLQSLSVVSFTASLKRFFPEVPPTFLFDCRNIIEASTYLARRFPEETERLESAGRTQRPPLAEPQGSLDEEAGWPALVALDAETESAHRSPESGIAVIGMHCRFPGATDPAEFWKNLVGGVDSVGEIPTDRWTLQGFFAPNDGERQPGRSYSKWGAFLENVDCFDARFFGISPREAALMDPQERLFLEVAWHAMEDAALFGERAAHLKGEDGYDVGVFVGVTTNTYLLNGPDRWREGQPEIPASMPWSIANRVSYCLDLRGPSFAIDTACSSSLVAIHLACESLARNECAVAIAGGVNLYLHPAKYIQLCQQQMLSPSGRCRSFGEDADGFTPGEGVGAVILKPLDTARRDGDRILAVIRGTAINHNGKTNGYTVPKARSQAALVRKALSQGAVSPDSIGSIEAHGTGTKLGDPIEVSGLAEALGDKYQGDACALASVKSNIGHLESAAGVASLVKTILQMRHRQFAPSLHAEHLNPALCLENTRFFVPRELQSWPSPRNGGPRRAGISSFGAGGTNAHIIVEEASPVEPAASISGPAVFPLSARSRERLHALAEALLAQLTKSGTEARNLAELAYTLQCGRRHLEHRLAIAADSHGELTDQLRRFLSCGRTPRDSSSSEETNPASVFEGIADPEDRHPPRSTGSGDCALARAWAGGEAVRWLDHWRQVPLPGSAPRYPFDPARHGLRPLPIKAAATARDKTLEAEGADRIIRVPHDSIIFRDHHMAGRPFLPATAYIAHCHGRFRPDAVGTVVELRDLSWLRPISPDGETDVSLRFKIHDNTGLSFELANVADPGQVCFKGSRTPNPTEGPKLAIGLDEARTRCARDADVPDLYRRFQDAGMVYGPSFRCLDAAWLGSGEVLAELRQRAEAEPRASGAAIDPAMLDSAMQAAALLLERSGESLRTPLVPFSARTIRIFAPLGRHAFAHARRRHVEGGSGTRFDFVIFAPDGRVLLEIEDFCFRPLPAVANHEKAATVPELHLLQPEWVAADRAGDHAESAPTLLFDTNVALFDDIRTLAPDLAAVTRLAIPGPQYEIRDDATIRWTPHDVQHASLLWRSILAAGSAPTQLVFHIRADNDEKSGVGSLNGQPKTGSLFEAVEILRTICGLSDSKRFHIRVILSGPDIATASLSGAMAGLLRAISLEMPVSATVISAPDSALADSGKIIDELKERRVPGVTEIRLSSGKRYRKRLVFAETTLVSRDADPNFAADEVFLITGGAGAVANRLALALAQRGVKRLALVGRSHRTEKTDALLASLARYGAIAEYRQTDCTKSDEMAIALSEFGRRLGPVTGILHCAGTLNDGFFLRQTAEDLVEASRAKILGACCLDDITAHAPLRWFILCSALAGVLGNIGQSHYAFANAWIDGFAEARNARVSRGERHGTTIAIAWPLWDTSAGMQASPRLVRQLNESGIPPIRESEAEEIFFAALQSPSRVIIPLKGDKDTIARFAGLVAPAMEGPPGPRRQQLDGATTPSARPETLVPENQASAATSRRDGSLGIENIVTGFLAECLASVTETALSKIDVDASLDLFGLDSILVMELNALLEPHFPSLAKTAAFEARSIRALARLIVGEHDADAERFASPRGAVTGSIVPASRATKPPPEPSPPESKAIDQRAGDIAIIGLAGRYPGSNTLDAFWNHLVAGDDLVSTIPERWPDFAWGAGGPDKHGKVYARWGAFLDDFDKFDPLFFGISPRDAERMDPQERLFLQTAWHAIEDAGYTPETLSGRRGEARERCRVGVIAGVMYGEYQMYGAAAGAGSSMPLTNSSYASVANRVSFCLDLDGPSFAVDSMCSSSLSAIHLAAGLIRSRDCDMAIAGGVNLSLHPYKYRMLCELGFASTDGRCRSFGDGGDGYVPGEGVGAVLLKALPLAVRDGDHIYGVIRGSDIGHGGRSSGYTVPNVDAQADVIRNATRRSGLETSRISYVEAHGTGTNLGDPIEIRGLSKALAQGLSPGRRVPIGSVKSNIGHLESAAGIAALTKVLLQMKHRRLVPSIHSEPLNANINFAGTPFDVQTQSADWIARDGRPRVSAISSFGAGGSNAHIIVEEFIPRIPVTEPTGAQLFSFSARGWTQLAEQLRLFADHLDRELVRDPDATQTFLSRDRFTMEDVARTLSLGRRWFRCRCAIVAETFDELYELVLLAVARLNNADKPMDADDVTAQRTYFGEAETSSNAIANDPAVARGLDARALAWVRGEPTGPLAAAADSWRKVPLPGSAFQRDRYWINDDEAAASTPSLPKHPELLRRDWLGFETIDGEITPELILERVRLGKLDQDGARIMLEALIETEGSLS